MQTISTDVRVALRLARRRPVHTLVALLTLAIGVGGITVVFTVVNSLLLRPLPVPNGHRLVRVFGASDDRAFDVLSYPNARDFAAATSLAGLALHQQVFAAAGLGDATDTAAVELVSGDYFTTFGVPAAIGRTIQPADDQLDGAALVAVVSDDWWRTHLGEAAGALGASVHLNGTAFRVVGVAPAGFRGSYQALETDIYVPLMAYERVRPRGLAITSRNWGWLNATGRMQPGATVAQVRAELETIAAALARAYPGSARGLSVTVVAAQALPEEMGPALRQLSLFALVVAGLALAAACANVASAQLASVIARRREIAVRLAMGATRARLVRQWLTESVLLAAVATAGGLLLALWARDGFAWLAPPHPELANVAPDLALDWRVLAFAALVAAGVTVLFGGWPALRAARLDVTTPLKEDGATTIGGRRPALAHATLVVVQVAVSLTLLVSAGLLIRSLSAASAFDLGFDAANLTVAQPELSGLGYTDARTRAYYRETAERLRALPGIEAVTFSAVVALSDSRESRGVAIEGHAAPDGAPFIPTDSNVVATNYFDVLGIPIVQGRGFLPSDGGDTAAPVAIVNETMARRYWPGGAAVGRLVRLGNETPPVEIVGVARDVTYYRIAEAPLPYLYLPFGPVVMPGLAFQLRTAGPGAAPPGMLRRELRAGDPRIRVPLALSFADARQMPLYPSRVLAIISGACGLLALLLTALGVYGVVLHAVSQRTREFAVRLALGAQPGDLVAGVLRHGVALTAAGLVIGVGGAAALARLLQGFLVGVSPFEPLTVAGLGAVVVMVALGASYAPARRATRIDPAAVLAGRS